MNSKKSLTANEIHENDLQDIGKIRRQPFLQHQGSISKHNGTEFRVRCDPENRQIDCDYNMNYELNRQTLESGFIFSAKL